MANRKIEIHHKAVEALLKSREIQNGLVETAEIMIDGDSRYSIERDTEGRERTSVNIIDNSPNALRHEIMTGRLSRMAKGNN